MKLYRYILLLAIIPAAARAQRPAAADSLYLYGQGKRAVTFSEQNGAQLVASDIVKISQAGISYRRDDGHFRPAQQAENSGTAAFGTSGIATLGRFKLYGDFSFSRMRQDSLSWSLKGLENEIDPYYFAAIKGGTWERINYDMHGILAYRLPGDHFYVAGGMEYYYQTAARSVDPRASVQDFRLLASPELIYRTGHQTFGLKLDWGYAHENNTISYRNLNYSSGQAYPDRILYQVFGYGNFAPAGVRALRRQISYDGAGVNYAYHDQLNYLQISADYRNQDNDDLFPLGNSTNYARYGSFYLHTTSLQALAGKKNDRLRQQLIINLVNNDGSDFNTTLGGSSYKYHDLLAALGYSLQFKNKEIGLKLTWNDHSERDLGVSHLFSYAFLQPEIPLAWYHRYTTADRLKLQLSPGVRLPLSHTLSIPQGELNQVFNNSVSYPDLRYRTATAGIINAGAEYLTPRLFEKVTAGLSANVIYQRALSDGVSNPNASLQPSGGFLSAVFRLNIYF